MESDFPAEFKVNQLEVFQNGRIFSRSFGENVSWTEISVDNSKTFQFTQDGFKRMFELYAINLIIFVVLAAQILEKVLYCSPKYSIRIIWYLLLRSSLAIILGASDGRAFAISHEFGCRNCRLISISHLGRLQFSPNRCMVWNEPINLHFFWNFRPYIFHKNINATNTKYSGTRPVTTGSSHFNW